MRNIVLMNIVSSLKTEEEMNAFIERHFFHKYCPKGLLLEMVGNTRSVSIRKRFKTLLVNHNVEYRKYERRYNKPSSAAKPHISSPANLNNAINSFTNAILDKNPKPKKSEKVLKKELHGKRGTRINERFCCDICRITVDEGWRYKTDDDTYRFCHKCKEKVKPSSFLKTHTSIIYTPMGNDKRRK